MAYPTRATVEECEGVEQDASNGVPEYWQMENGEPDYVRMILTAPVYDVCKETPCNVATQMSRNLGVRVYFKREDLQPIFSFKLRGAYNMMAQLCKEDLWKGVISCSAGNHAQGVAYSAAHLGVPATIVMPTATQAIKYENVKRLGAKVILHGENFDAAKAECVKLQKEHGFKYIPPYDNPFVIAGQGTIAAELVRQIDTKNLKAVFCAVGGGGLISGIAVYLKRIAPHVKVIGVETYDANAMYESLKANRRVTLNDVGLFADGAAVKLVGKETFRLCQKYVDEVVLVTTDEICAAISEVFEDVRAIIEPAGALPAAGIKKYLELHPEELPKSNLGDAVSESAYCAILSGANMNLDRLGFVSERSRLGAGKEVFLAVEMDDRPGTFKELIECISPRDVTEFSYRYNDAAKARVYISFSVKNRAEIPNIICSIDKLGMKTYDLSDNDLAKTHTRYMVGGTPHLPDEQVFTFEFPERPGALMWFLDCIKSTWNLTLFNYKFNGSDIGHILAGIRVSKLNYGELEQTLKRIGYAYREETENIAYKLFLE